MRLIKYLKPYFIYAILAAVSMIGEVICDLYLPLHMKDIIDIGIKQSQTNVIYEHGIYMLILACIGGVCGFLSAVFASVCSQKFANDLRKDTFQKVLNISWEQTDKFTTGSLVTRITNDVTAVQQLVAMSVRMFVRTFMLFFGGITFMLSIEPEFGYILMAVLPCEIILLVLFIRRVNPLFSQVQTSLDGVNEVMQENVTGARVVKAFANEEYEKERFNKSSVNLSNVSIKVQKLMAYMSPFLTFFLDVTVILIILVGGNKVFQDVGFEIGSVSAALTYVMQILMAVMSMGMLFQNVARASASSKRILAVLDTKPSIISGTNTDVSMNGVVEFKDVTFKYSTGNNVIENISFKLNEKETLAILGATGSGKTTIVNLIPRFFDVTSGDIYINDVSVKEYDLEYLRKNIGIVLQKSELFSGSILDNIKWGNSEATMEEVIWATKIAQAHDFISSFKNGYDTIIGEKGSSLSGGQKQRICIARAILKKPKLLIFDDATSALDLSTEAKLYQALKEALDDTSIILIAQRVASAKGADKILVLDDGKVSDIGTNEYLLEHNSVYQDIYYSQLKKEGGNL